MSDIRLFEVFAHNMDWQMRGLGKPLAELRLVPNDLHTSITAAFKPRRGLDYFFLVPMPLTKVEMDDADRPPVTTVPHRGGRRLVVSRGDVTAGRHAEYVLVYNWSRASNYHDVVYHGALLQCYEGCCAFGWGANPPKLHKSAILKRLEALFIETRRVEDIEMGRLSVANERLRRSIVEVSHILGAFPDLPTVHTFNATEVTRAHRDSDLPGTDCTRTFFTENAMVCRSGCPNPRTPVIYRASWRQDAVGQLLWKSGSLSVWGRRGCRCARAPVPLDDTQISFIVAIPTGKHSVRN